MAQSTKSTRSELIRTVTTLHADLLRVAVPALSVRVGVILVLVGVQFWTAQQALSQAFAQSSSYTWTVIVLSLFAPSAALLAELGQRQRHRRLIQRTEQIKDSRLLAALAMFNDRPMGLVALDYAYILIALALPVVGAVSFGAEWLVSLATDYGWWAGIAVLWLPAAGMGASICWAWWRESGRRMLVEVLPKRSV